jgi:hypothetical protein
MTYLQQDKIATNGYMLARVAQAAAQEHVAADPDRWTYDNRRLWAAAPGWDEAWNYALLTHEDDPEYDPGNDEAVITDGQILSQVQAMTSPPPQ